MLQAIFTPDGVSHKLPLGVLPALTHALPMALTAEPTEQPPTAKHARTRNTIFMAHLHTGK